jgi:transcriptional regulator with XRE-family HTH domain
MVRLQGMSRIRAWRVYRGLSTSALARKIKKSHSYVVQLENGTRQGTFKTMSLLADCLGTTLDGLRD